MIYIALIEKDKHEGVSLQSRQIRPAWSLAVGVPGGAPTTRTSGVLEPDSAAPTIQLNSMGRRVTRCTYHCMSARLSSPSSKTFPSSPFDSPRSPPIYAVRVWKSPLLVWRILNNRLSTGPLALASCRSCLCLNGSASVEDRL